MNGKKRDKFIIALFCLFLGGMLLLFVLLPKTAFSVKEKRYLAEAPSLRLADILSGRFGSQAETYAAEHLPGRDFFVGLNAAFEHLTGRQGAKEIFTGRSGRLYESPAALDEAGLKRKLDAINAFAETAWQPVTLLLVPEAGYLLSDDLPASFEPYYDAEILDAVRTQAGDGVEVLDLRDAFATDTETLYYRTDHHWTSRGAWLAASLYGGKSGHPLPGEDAYTVTAVPGFYGTTYSRAALWLTPAETLELWDSGGAFTVENADHPGVHEGLFYREHLSEPDKYPVFLDGNHSLVRIRGEGTGKLLVIRDSFASCAGGFLADGWGEVVLVDLRYYRDTVSDLLSEGFDNILVLYGLRNFMTDGNIGWLE